MVDDTSLYRRASQGDVTALNEVVTRYRPLVYAICLAEVGQVTMAEDLTQDVFVTMYRRFNTLHDPDKFRPWIRTIARNVCRMWRRRHPDEAVPLEVLPDQHDPVSSAACHHAELEALVQGLLGHVSPRSREVLLLRYFAEYSEVEIAAALGLTVTTVKSRLHEARTQGQRILKRFVEDTLVLQHSSEDIVRQIMEQCGHPGCQCPATLVERR